MRTSFALMAAAALVSAACDRDVAGPSEGALPLDDVVVLATVQDASTGSVIFAEIDEFGAFGPPPPQGTVRRAFARTRECAAGGTVTVTGEVERVSDGAGTVEFFLEGQKTSEECARQRGDLTLTVSGNSTFEARRRSVNRQPDGPQTFRETGHFRWERSDGEAGECDFDLSSERDPTTRTRSVTGTICGRAIERTLFWEGGT